MIYVVTLTADEYAANHSKFRTEMRFTKALPKGLTVTVKERARPSMALVLSPDSQARNSQAVRHLSWIGVVSRHNTVGAVDYSITVDPFRECFEAVSLDGQDGLLNELPVALRGQFSEVALGGPVGVCDDEAWNAFQSILRQRHPNLVGLLDWLIAQANPPVFDSRDPADRAWQEQADSAGCLLRIADFPLAALAAWQRPASRDAPYLAGLIPQPVEQSMIEHDVRVAGNAFGLLSEWQLGDGARCDINVLRDTSGRTLEVANVNATPVESRLGTDMIYFHHPTESFVLVQYKRLDPLTGSIYVDKRLRSQLDRLEEVARLSKASVKPSDWRLGSDACFLKLANWTDSAGGRSIQTLAPGMYLPVSYVRLLLNDDCTRGSQAGGSARLLGYDQVERHLVGTQFVELVKHGLAGTVGVTVERLRELVTRRIDSGQSVVVAVERSPESPRKRQARIRKRGARPSSYSHSVLSTDRTEP